MILSISVFLLTTKPKDNENQAKINKITNIADNTAPIIKLVGDDNVYFNLNANYIDNGAAAVDDIDGDLTSKIKTTNSVDTSKAGLYKVKYTVMDSSKNQADITRTVTVIEEPLSSSGVPILMYHFFYDKSKGQTGQDGNFVEISDFEQQVKYLKDNNFYFPTWSELDDYLDGKNNLPNKSVIITDDDGSESFFNLAYPVLEKYNTKVTSFLITSWSGDPATFNVNRSLISFQSHSHDMHKAGCSTGHGGLFQCISEAEGLADLKTSVDLLGSNDAFCYPFGDYNDHTKNLLKKTGFKVALTTEYGKAKFGADKLALPRIRISGGQSLDSFIDLVN